MRKFDIIISKGRIVDPASNTDCIMDIAIRDGKVAQLDEAISDPDAINLIDGHGLIISPGLIDIHAHVFLPGLGLGASTNEICFQSGVTTIVDAGSTGAATFPLLDEHLRGKLDVTFKAFLHISSIGLADLSVGESTYLDLHDEERTAAIATKYSDLIVGIKVRLGRECVGENGLVPLELAKSAAKIAGGLPTMIHLTNPPVPLATILKRLDPGDIVSHFLHGRGFGLLDDQGFVCTEAWAAKERRIIFDFAHGRRHLDFEVARKAINQGFFPDTLSTDLPRAGRTGTAKNMPHILSKFLNLGMSLNDVIKCCTVNPANILGLNNGYGRITVSGPADISAFSLEEGKFRYEDTEGQEMYGSTSLVPQFTIKNGEVVWHRATQ